MRLLKTKNIEFNKLKRCARFHGGLFMGLKINFPCGMVTDDFKEQYTNISLVIGLIFWTWQIDYNYNIKPYEN